MFMANMVEEVSLVWAQPDSSRDSTMGRNKNRTECTALPPKIGMFCIHSDYYFNIWPGLCHEKLKKIWRAIDRRSRGRLDGNAEGWT